MLLSGAIAGIAGMLEVAGTVHRLQGGISNNFGYLGIMVAVLARGSALGVLADSGADGGDPQCRDHLADAGRELSDRAGDHRTDSVLHRDRRRIRLLPARTYRSEADGKK